MEQIHINPEAVQSYTDAQAGRQPHFTLLVRGETAAGCEMLEQALGDDYVLAAVVDEGRVVDGYLIEATVLFA